VLVQDQNIKECREGTIRLSIVSHEQDDLVRELLASIAEQCRVDCLKVTITRNTQAPCEISFDSFPFPIEILQNPHKKGFGANHNSAFNNCREEFFCVLNPDIIITTDPFPDLQASLQNKKLGVVSPVLYDSSGVLQDSARSFPTPLRILKKIINHNPEDFLVSRNTDDFSPDWVAGMFMLFPAETFRLIGGFDEAFFMYYEDADICKRLSEHGYTSKVVVKANAVHNARRASHRSLRYMYWHLSSMFRFFFRYPFFQL